VPTRVLAPGLLDIGAELEGLNCFAGVVLEGMLSHRFRLADQTALRLVGPRDVISLNTEDRTMLICETDCRVVEPTRIALLGQEVLVGMHRWPRLLPGLHVSMAAQADRLVAQIAVCQLPRVDERVMAMMWLLAEMWGHVTAAGTSLPLSLTHDVLGGLVGARRSTVTLALGQLSDRGALVRQSDGWLLLEPPPAPSGRPTEFEEPRILRQPRSPWHRDEPEQHSSSPMAAEWLAVVGRLRAEHLRNRDEVRRNLERCRLTRSQMTERVRRRPSPSG
jgi:CRP/FNR family transcriptional regulator, cyclic AMP receptor protein